jgi:hypothetical protein
LRSKEGDAAKGLPVLKVNRKTVGELFDDVVTDYKNRDRKTTKKVEGRIKKHPRPFFGALNAATVSDDQVRAYIAQRKADRAKNATINRELAILRRGYLLNPSSSPCAPRLRCRTRTTCGRASSSAATSSASAPPYRRSIGRS